jgi:hypothetical protein
MEKRLAATNVGVDDKERRGWMEGRSGFTKGSEPKRKGRN